MRSLLVLAYISSYPPLHDHAFLLLLLIGSHHSGYKVHVLENDNNIDMMQIINDLAYTRMSGTENDEVKCKEYLVGKFRLLGIEPTIEPVSWSRFPTNVLIRLVVAFIFCGLLGGLIFEWMDLALLNLIFIIMIIIILLSVIGAQQSKIDWFSKLGKMEQTHNIIAKLPAKNMDEEKATNIVFVAHHDTKTQTVTTIIRSISYIIGLFAALVMGILFVTSSILKLVGILPSSFTGIKWTLVVIMIASAPFLFILLANKAKEGTSLGSLDNATGMAIVLKLLEHFGPNPLGNTNLWFLITGAEEWGMDGAIDFWKKHGVESKELNPATTIVFNFDMVAQELSYIEKFGMPRRKPYNKQLNAILSKTASDLGISFNGFWLPMLGTTDGWIFKVHGCDTADIITEKTARYTHSGRDTPAVCDEKTMKEAVALTINTVEKIETR